MATEYRHEKKHEISYCDMLEIRQRLLCIAKTDSHAAANGKYFVRSLYFDTLSDKSLREKIEGVNYREKFRIRCYNLDASAVFLEKKSKINGLCRKESVRLTEACASEISNGDYTSLRKCGLPLANEFLRVVTNTGLIPKTVVDYTREPFVYAPGNVRVTVDTDIRCGISQTDFLNLETVTVSAGNSIILEVKWDEYLPDIIRDAVQLKGRMTTSFSKYAACRVYG